MTKEPSNRKARGAQVGNDTKDKDPKRDAEKPKKEGEKPKKETDKAKKDEAKDQLSLSHSNLKVGNNTLNLENINITTYVCDFGNVVVGSAKKKSFRLTNVGKIAVTFNFDKKLLNQAGITIEPDKAQKVAPNSSVLFNVAFTTRKNAKTGKQRWSMPIEVKSGPQYTIDFVANLTTPELHLSCEFLNFEKVCVHTRKTVQIRLENQKEVNCEWWYHTKSETPAIGVGASAQDRQRAEGERFQVWPQSGMLLPGQRQIVDVMFTPNADKLFNQKLTFKCKENN